MTLNAVSRQIVQNLELRPFWDVTAGPVRAQWSPLVLFLVAFVAGIAVAVWIVRQAVRALGGRAAPSAEDPTRVG